MVTENVNEFPSHPLYVGVTVIFPEIGTPELFCGAFQDIILPVPFAFRPIDVF